MKFLPRKYRESQSDCFAKRGLPWHITVAVRWRSDQQLELMSFVHLFKACSQDSNTVLGIMADVLKKLKIGMPNLDSVFYQQDNAGCYHCALTIVGAKAPADKAGVSLKRLDFSDPQGGKGACDRKAATIKSHMQIFLNAGNDIKTAAQMKAAIESSGGVPGVKIIMSPCQKYRRGKRKMPCHGRVLVLSTTSSMKAIVCGCGRHTTLVLAK